MDFIQIATKELKGGGLEAYPDFVVGRTNDLMVRAKNFYAIWDEEMGLWSTDEFDVVRLVDKELEAYKKAHPDVTKLKKMRNFSSNGQSTFRKYMSQISDNARPLDENLTFLGTRVLQKDYVSKRLPYGLSPGDHSAWEELVSTLYKPDERAKIEWGIGSIIAGDSKTNQKFLVLHGPPGAGKGTIINIVMMLFQGYYTTFDAKALGSSNNQFAAAAFSSNPLVAIQHDGDLSRIEDNTILNSIVSHEIMRINEKHKPAYDARLNAFLLMGTNKPVKITDAQSGLIRRLIDVYPSGVKLPPKQYHALMDRINFELGAIAHHCLQVYKSMGKNYYSNYQPTEMMFRTNAFANYIDANYAFFEKQNGVSLKQAWSLYKEYCDEATEGKRGMTMYAFKAELRNYFEDFHDEHRLSDGTPVRNWYAGFKDQLFKTPVDDDPTSFTLALEETISLLDLELADYPAQYASAAGTPTQRWANVKTVLADLDTTREHFVQGFPSDLIVIDFDLVDENGEKSLERNLEAASLWPPTYAELSKSGKAVHLTYKWIGGDPSLLDNKFEDGIEIKVYSGGSSLRRRLTRCNNVPIATLNSGLPFKEKKRVMEPGSMNSAKTLRRLIVENLNKKHHPGTKPSIDFISHLLTEAYEDGLTFNVEDMKPHVIAFALASTNKQQECLKIVEKMRWKSDDVVEEENKQLQAQLEDVDPRLVIYDVEVFPNLFVICWKFEEDDPKKESVIRMINPKPHEVEALFKLKLVGFNVKHYDNHIMYAAAMGYNNQQLYELSTRIIAGAKGSRFGSAYNISYTDIYDFSSNKQGLKKWQIAYGLEHKEIDLPFEEPVPEDRIMDVVEYCVNDVVSTEHVFKRLRGDWQARLLLSDLSGLTPNHSTAEHTARIVFGKAKDFQRDFQYTKLDRDFPGYVYDAGVSTYKGRKVGEGGFVFAEPGIYTDVALLDVDSMHPNSIIQLNLFGDEYTPKFKKLVDAQMAIKEGRYADAKTLFDGKLIPYVEEIEEIARRDPDAAKKAAFDLRYGLKIAINIVYGLTSAKFDNPFRDIRNKDNIVAKRGSLFMIDLLEFIQSLGYKVCHIKTDSVKIPNATPEIIEEVKKFGEKYGYSFKLEETYAKLGLVNDAVYVAKKDECVSNCWSATGTQYIPERNPYVFKKLFGYEDDINFNDFCRQQSVVKGKLYLDFGIHEEETEPLMGWVDQAAAEQKELKKAGASEEAQAQPMIDALKELVFVGRTGLFTPVKEGYGGGQLWRVMDGKAYAVSGTKGHLWVESHIAMDLPDEAIDVDYFENLLQEARDNLEQFLVGSDFHTLDEFLS